MSRVVHFEIHVDDPNRASKFYTDVFGWKFNKWEGPMDYWLISTGDSIMPRYRWRHDEASRPDGECL